MIEDYYVKPSTIDRVRSSYLEWLEAHRYSRLVVYRRLPLLFHFGEFAQKKGCKDVASCKAYIKEFVSQWSICGVSQLDERRGCNPIHCSRAVWLRRN
jgi:integrase/recombinase XerD